MNCVLDHTFLPEKYFEEITKIPHGSFHEKPLSDYLADFAQEHGLRYKQYPNWNVIIYKPASPGYEDHEPVMLQGHIDMVCEKEPGYEHDFEKDPLTLYVTDDGFLHAKGTTLGADDGVAVAYMLAFLEDDTLPHPPLECVFTVQEEVGLLGAAGLAFEDISAKRMIGLDDMGGSTCYVSACGCQFMQLDASLSRSACDLAGYKFTVGGLEGGHSGTCINKERGNALKIAARTMYEICRKYDVRIETFDGGSKDNAIPVQCEVVFGSDADKAELDQLIEKMQSSLLAELEFSDPAVFITLDPAECGPAFSMEDSRKLVELLYILPDGFRHKSLKIEGLTTVSENLANIRTDSDGHVVIRSFPRSEIESYLDLMQDEYEILSKAYGFKLTCDNRAPGWSFRQDSKIRASIFKAYHEVTGGEMKMISEHGGLEGGYICGGIPGIDIVMCGPYVDGFHTPRERLDLASFRTTYEVLKLALKEL